jgi:hypothetical protein
MIYDQKGVDQNYHALEFDFETEVTASDRR